MFNLVKDEFDDILESINKMLADKKKNEEKEEEKGEK